MRGAVPQVCSTLALLSGFLAAVACKNATAVVGTFRLPRPSDPIVLDLAGAGAVDAAVPGASANADTGVGSPPLPAADSGGGVMPAIDSSTTHPPAGAAAGRSGSAPPPAAFTIEPGTRQQFCSGHGPALRVQSSANPATPGCARSLTRRLLGYGVCACRKLALEGQAFSLDAFDSRQGAYSAGQSGVAAGANDTVSVTAPMIELRGSLFIAGRDPLTFVDSELLVRGDFMTNARIAIGNGSLRVGRDVWANADLVLSAKGALEIGRDLRLAPGHSTDPAISIAGEKREGGFVIDPPCACEPGDGLDIEAIVKQAHASNDNAEAAVAKDALQALLFTGATDIACGRLALNGVAVNVSTVGLKFARRTALFVDGDFTANLTTVWIDPGATGELDLFITGNLILTGLSQLGNVERPSALRIYVGGQVSIGAGSQLAAHVYAPNASIALAGTPDSYGSILAAEIRVSGTHHLHYDRAILEAGDCGAATNTCTGCNSGSCGACASDADCCAPTVCVSHKCQLL